MSAKAIGYIRVSTDRQELGPEVQRGAITKKAEELGLKVLWFEDIGVSGGDEPSTREGLTAALAAISKDDVLIVASRDRLARDMYISMAVERVIQKAKGKLLSCNSSNGDTPQDILMNRLQDAFAEYERMLIKQRTKMALAIKKSRGERIGPPPFGWDLDGEMLIKNAEEQKVIRMVLKMRKEKMAQRAIMRELNAQGIPTKYGRTWGLIQVQNILKRNSI